MSVTSFQRRANDRRRFWHGYAVWLDRRLGEDGGVAHVVRYEIATTVRGTARVMWGTDMAYQRKGRRYRRYRAVGS